MSTGKKPSDEISWKDLQDHLIWWLNLFAGAIDHTIRSVRRHPLLFASCILFFIGLAMGFLYSRSQQYEAETTFVYVDLHPKIFGDMATKLNTLVANGDSTKVAELMDLEVSDAAKIKKVSVSDSRGKPFYQNYSMRKEPMIITIDLKDIMPEDTLESAIGHYFNSNPFTSDRLELKKQLLAEELAYIEKKIETIDSILVNVYLVNPEKSTSSIRIEDSKMDDAYELLKFSRELLQRKSDIENGLVNPENVFAIDKMIILPKARFTLPSIIKYSLAAIIAGFIFAIGILILRKLISVSQHTEPA